MTLLNRSHSFFAFLLGVCAFACVPGCAWTHGVAFWDSPAANSATVPASNTSGGATGTFKSASAQTTQPKAKTDFQFVSKQTTEKPAWATESGTTDERPTRIPPVTEEIATEPSPNDAIAANSGGSPPPPEKVDIADEAPGEKPQEQELADSGADEPLEEQDAALKREGNTNEESGIASIPEWMKNETMAKPPAEPPTAPKGDQTTQQPSSKETPKNRPTLPNSIVRDPLAQPVGFERPTTNPHAAPPRSWTESLKQTIVLLEQQLQAPTVSPPQREELESKLRLLNQLAGQKDAAQRPIPGVSPARQEYWRLQLAAIDTITNTADGSPSGPRTQTALQQLRAAIRPLADEAPITINNLTFCTRVDSYGRFTKFPNYSFPRGAEVLLYAEIENFVPVPVGEGTQFATELQARWEIRSDADGTQVAVHTFEPDKEICSNRRRDFFIPYHFNFPAEVPPGKYTLRLTVEDKNARKSGVGAIKFEIRE